MMYGESVSEHLSPVRRAGRLLMLLRERRKLEDLRAMLGIGPAQLRNDIRDLRAEGWVIKEEQTYVPAAADTQQVRRGPKLVWLADASASVPDVQKK